MLDRLKRTADAVASSKFWARYGWTTLVATVVFAILLVCDRSYGAFSVIGLTVDDDAVRGQLFSSLIEISGLLLAVFIAVLSVVTTLSDERPVVKVMKKDLRNYDELVHRLVGPVFTILLLAAICIACLLIPSAKGAAAAQRGIIISSLPSVALALGIGLLVQTASVASLLAKVLLFRGREPGKSSSVDAAKRRLDDHRNKAKADAAAADASERGHALDAPAPQTA